MIGLSVACVQNQRFLLKALISRLLSILPVSSSWEMYYYKVRVNHKIVLPNKGNGAGEGVGHKSPEEQLMELGVIMLERKRLRGDIITLQLPERKLQTGGGQSLLPGKKCQNKRKWPQAALWEVYMYVSCKL